MKALHSRYLFLDNFASSVIFQTTDYSSVFSCFVSLKVFSTSGLDIENILR